MYSAIGNYFLNFLNQKLGIKIIEKDPWERYCRIIEVFTSYGFYSHVELKTLEENKYWMLEHSDKKHERIDEIKCLSSVFLESLNSKVSKVNS